MPLRNVLNTPQRYQARRRQALRQAQTVQTSTVTPRRRRMLPFPAQNENAPPAVEDDKEEFWKGAADNSTGSGNFIHGDLSVNFDSLERPPSPTPLPSSYSNCQAFNVRNHLNRCTTLSVPPPTPLSQRLQDNFRTPSTYASSSRTSGARDDFTSRQSTRSRGIFALPPNRRSIAQRARRQREALQKS